MSVECVGWEPEGSQRGVKLVLQVILRACMHDVGRVETRIMEHDSCFLGPCLPAWFCERIPIVATLVDAATRLTSTIRHGSDMI